RGVASGGPASHDGGPETSSQNPATHDPVTQLAPVRQPVPGHASTHVPPQSRPSSPGSWTRFWQSGWIVASNVAVSSTLASPYARGSNPTRPHPHTMTTARIARTRFRVYTLRFRRRFAVMATRDRAPDPLYGLRRLGP